MQLEFLFGLSALLAILVGSVCGALAYRQVGQLRTDLAVLANKIAQQSDGKSVSSDTPTRDLGETLPSPFSPSDATSTSSPQRTEETQLSPEPRLSSPRQISGGPSPTPTEEGLAFAREHLREHWMAWLGGTCLGLAGIFMVTYSIEQGLLDPATRIVLSALTGMALWATAEILRRRLQEPASVFAAMAAGGSVTLFAAILAATHLYEFLSLDTAFFLLGVTALITMVLALFHGPLLAGLGILGAYVVPILVSTNSGNVEAALGYSAVVTASALLLFNFVSRAWLWWGTLLGAMSWWLLSLGASEPVLVRGWYLFVIGYLFAAIPHFDFFLQRTTDLKPPANVVSSYIRSAFNTEQANTHAFTLLITFLLLASAAAFSIYLEAQYQALILRWMPLLILTLLVARRHEALVLAAWCAVITTLAAWLSVHIDAIDGRLYLDTLAENSSQFFLYLTTIAAVVSTVGLWNYGTGRSQHTWVSLALVTPVLSLLTGYLISEPQPDTWALLLFIAGFIYTAIACILINNPNRSHLIVWLFFAGNLAIASAIAIRFAPQTLTFALALQLVSLAWILRRFHFDLSWLIKVLTTILIVRLTVNPWLIGYSTEDHWSLWAYGGSTLCCLAALRLLHPRHNANVDTTNIAAWLEGAALHLAALTLWVELRYFLYDGDIFQSNFTALEAGLNTVLFGSITIVYIWRSRVSTKIGFLYRWFANLALTLACLNYLVILFATVFGFPWIHSEIGSTAIANLGLLFYAPPILLFLGLSKFDPPAFKSWTWGAAGFAAFVFINLQIRHLWNGSFYVFRDMANPELLTYSGVWLVVAVVTLSNGLRTKTRHWYPVGLAMLALVIAKIFLIDMADLTGLLRVASFLGLGLALIGLSFLHQKFSVSGRLST